MSRQVYFYLLPNDVTQLMESIRSRLDMYLLRRFSQTTSAVELETPYADSGDHDAGVECCLARRDADVQLRYIDTRSIWHVADRSEVIQFSGCEFDGELLLVGRFYYQTDLLADGMVAPHKQEFLAWANRVFRIAKRSLRYSKSLDAYVGEHAAKWKADGGRFAWMVTPQRGPLCADE